MQFHQIDGGKTGEDEARSTQAGIGMVRRYRAGALDEQGSGHLCSNLAFASPCLRRDGGDLRFELRGRFGVLDNGRFDGELAYGAAGEHEKDAAFGEVVVFFGERELVRRGAVAAEGHFLFPIRRF